MTEPTNKHSDPLEEYLQGRSDVSKHYRELPAETPPPELDEKILMAARDALKPRAWRWTVPLSAAAAIVLTVGVVLQMQQEGISPVPQDSAPMHVEEAAPRAELPAPPSLEKEAATAAAQSRDDSARTQAPAGAAIPERRLEQKAAPAPAAGPQTSPQATEAEPAVRAKAAPRESPVEGLAAPSAPDEMSEEGEVDVDSAESPEQWIERIRRLRADGETGKADAELDAFRRRHPDYRLPEDLHPTN